MNQSEPTSQNPVGGNIDPDVFLYEDTRRNYPRLWIAKYFHRGARGQELQFFPNRLWQRQLYEDNSTQITWQAAAQIGKSEWAMCGLFAHAYNGRIVLYVLPTDTDRNLFVPRRIDRTIDRVPFYRDHCGQTRKGSDMKSQKTLFGVDCLFLGSNSETAFFEKPIDVLIIDEYDKCNQNNLIYASDRLASSASQHVYRFGNPTTTGRGIAAEYEKSDQKVWQLKCLACNTWQSLSWFENFVVQDDKGWRLLGADICSSSATGGDIPMLCRSCKKPIDRLAKGQWVAAFLDRPISGYQVSRLFGDARRQIDGVPLIQTLFNEWVDAQYNHTKLQRFHNNILGIPYESSGNKITEADIRACHTDYGLAESSEAPCVAGVDQGGILHVKIVQVVDDVEVLRWAGTVPTFDELSRVCRLFNVETGVIDWMPNTHSAREFIWADDTPGVWYGCTYHPTAKVSDFKVDYRERTVLVDRTQSLDDHHASWRHKKQAVPNGWESIDGGEWVKQMVAPVRVEVEKSGGRVVFVWDEGGRADHYHHASNYCHLAKRIAYGVGCGVKAI